MTLIAASEMADAFADPFSPIIIRSLFLSAPLATHCRLPPTPQSPHASSQVEIAILDWLLTNIVTTSELSPFKTGTLFGRLEKR
jgi:hypothetical protein